MKICLSIISLIAISVFAYANATNIEKLVKEKTGVNAKVVKELSLNEIQMNLVVLEANNQRIPFFASNDGNTLIGVDSSFLTSQDKLLTKLQLALQEVDLYNNRSKNDKLLASINGKNYPVVTLKSDKKTNNTLYIVSDPNCPYCQDELEHIEERLKDKNVKMIVVGILSDSSLSKASDIYEHIKNAKNNQAKIDTLRRIYSSSYQSNTAPSKEALEITNIVRQSGIAGVPYRFDVVE